MAAKPPPALGSAPVKRLKAHLTYGNLWLYLLSLVRSKGKAYAYNLDSEIEAEFLFRPSRVMVYVVLHRLELEGLVKSEAEGASRRKYYSLTEKGTGALAMAKEYLTVLSKKL